MQPPGTKLARLAPNLRQMVPKSLPRSAKIATAVPKSTTWCQSWVPTGAWATNSLAENEKVLKKWLFNQFRAQPEFVSRVLFR